MQRTRPLSTGYERLTPLEKIRRARETRPMDQESAAARVASANREPGCFLTPDQLKEDMEAQEGK